MFIDLVPWTTHSSTIWLKRANCCLTFKNEQNIPVIPVNEQ